MDDGKSVLHVAIAEYHMQSFKTILQFNPDVDTLVSQHVTGGS